MRPSKSHSVDSIFDLRVDGLVVIFFWMDSSSDAKAMQHPLLSDSVYIVVSNKLSDVDVCELAWILFNFRQGFIKNYLPLC